MTNAVRVGLGVIIVGDGKVLMGPRMCSHNGAGTWQFPGGHLEANETPEICSRREVKEETGLIVNDLYRGPWAYHVDDNGQAYATLFMIAPFCGGTPVAREPDKCPAWHWVEWDSMPSPRFEPIVHLLGAGFSLSEFMVNHQVSA